MGLNKLEQMKQYTIMVADTGDIHAIQKYQPEDCTTNPSLVFKTASQPEYSHLVDEAVQWAKQQSNPDTLGLALDKLAVRIGTELSKIVPGYVSTEVDAHLSFDTAAMIDKARSLIALYAEEGVGKERILIKLATTWEGVKAAEVLEQEGIRCNLTLVFCIEQAVACAQAGATLISPFVGRITDWYKKATNTSHYPPQDDPGVQSVKAIYQHFKAQGYNTIVMGASFRSAEQVEALAGCDRLTVSPALLEQLSNDVNTLTPALDAHVARAEPEPTLTQAQFLWSVSNNPMASEKLAEGIRLFYKDYLALKNLVSQRL